jgi:uncharacterized membrane protein
MSRPRLALRTVLARMVTMLAVAAAAALAAATSACGGNGGGPQEAQCPSTSSITCPATPPSFQTDVQPIIQERCYGCHGPGGVEYPTFNLTSYRGVVSNDVPGQVGECMMPPADAGQLTMAERTTLFEWIACVEPNN